MTRLFLIRHAEPEAAWGGAEDDPGLSAKGRDQAEAAAAALGGKGALAICSSPLRRCVETAQPFAASQGGTVRYDPRVGEVVAPPGTTDRRAWLRANFPWSDPTIRRAWPELDAGLHRWRADALDAVRALESDVAVFSHFIAINAIVGAALGREETIVCRPGHASITELALEDGTLTLVRLGAQMETDDVR